MDEETETNVREDLMELVMGIEDTTVRTALIELMMNEEIDIMKKEEAVKLLTMTKMEKNGLSGNSSYTT